MESSINKTIFAEQFASLQEISKMSAFSYQTLNYYTSLGLLKFQKRQGNKRLYATTDVKKRLSKIVTLKNKGYPLRVISSILNHNQDINNVSF